MINSTRVIALLALVVIGVGAMLGNFWFTYGLWPKSWTAFVLFAIASLILTSALQHVIKDDD